MRRVLLLVAALLAGGPAWAQTGSPARPLRVVVPYAPGGSSDVLARLLQPHLSAALGQVVVVENRPGAGAQIGIEAVARSEPDGLTVLLTDNALAVLPAVSERLPYDTRADLAPVTQLGRAPYLLAVRADLPASALGAFIALGRVRPEALSVGAGGVTGQIVAALIEQAMGLRLTLVPYRGGAPAVADLAGGRLDAMPTLQGTIAAQLAAGQVRAIGVLASERLPSLPDLPTLREQGHDLVMELWQGLLVPARTPPGLVARLAAAGAAAVRSPEIAGRLEALGIMPQAQGPVAFGALIAAETARYAAIAQARGIRAQ